MPETTIVLPMEPAKGLEALAYMRRGLTPAIVAYSYRPWTLALAQFVSTEHRWFHRLYARWHGFFWIACPRCLRKFGGHEIHTSIPAPEDGLGRGKSVCTYCTVELSQGASS